MGEVHKLIRNRGVDSARLFADSKHDRQCVDAAHAVMADEQRDYGIMHAGFAVTALPHKDIGDPFWKREAHYVTLLVESGRWKDGSLVGVPYGAIARMILFYLQTEAVKTGSCEVELGRSMNAWLGKMGIDNGGKTYQLVRKQCLKLSLCKLTFFKEISGLGQTFQNGAFVRDGILPEKDDGQLSLIRNTVRLDDNFYNSLINHPMPVREAALRELGSRSIAIDLYIWLAYRLHHLDRPTPISWAALHRQFGAGYKEVRQFKAKVKEPLALVLAVYEGARVGVDDAGLVLHPSPSPVEPREIIGVRA